MPRKTMSILMLVFTITLFNINEIGAFKNYSSTNLASEESIDSFKSLTINKQLC